MHPIAERKFIISKANGKVSFARKCKLLNVNRSSYNHKPKKTSELKLKLMRVIDEHDLGFPYKDVIRMYMGLTKDLGYSEA